MVRRCWAKWISRGWCTPGLCPQFLQQRLGLLEGGRVKHLREPAVDRGQEVSGLGTLLLAVSPASEACHRPSCQPCHVLTMCHITRRGHTPEGLVDSRARRLPQPCPAEAMACRCGHTCSLLPHARQRFRARPPRTVFPRRVGDECVRQTGENVTRQGGRRGYHESIALKTAVG